VGSEWDTIAESCWRTLLTGLQLKFHDSDLFLFTSTILTVVLSDSLLANLPLLELFLQGLQL
jgi:hypothetical protein